MTTAIAIIIISLLSYYLGRQDGIRAESKRHEIERMFDIVGWKK